MLAFNEGRGYSDLYGIEKSENAKIGASISDFLIEVSLIYCTDLPNTRFNLSKSNDRALLIRELNNAHDRINKDIIDSENPFLWLKSSVLNQEKQWLLNPLELILRYFSVYNKPDILKKIQDVIGLPYKEFIYCSFWLYGKFSDSFFYKEEELTCLTGEYKDSIFSRENICETLDVLCLEYGELKIRCKDEIVYDKDSIFNYHNAPHLIFPIIKYNNLLYCVNPQYILNQATKGMYNISKIFEDNCLDYGVAFENYIGAIIKENIRCNKDIVILPEQKYNKGQDKSSDWIIADENSIIFVECKTKKLTAASKSQLEIDEVVINKMIVDNNFSRNNINSVCQSLENDCLTKDIILLGIGIGKMYKACSDYKNNQIKSLPFDSSKAIHLIVVTLEEWLPKIPEFEKNMWNVAKGYLSYKNIDEKIFEENKPEIVTAQKLHDYIQIMGKIGISEFFRIKDCEEFEEQRKSINYDSVHNMFKQEFPLFKD